MSKVKKFSKLKFWQQQALIMHTLEGLSYKDIHAALPDVPYDTMYGAIQRLREHYPARTIEQSRRLPTIFVIGDTQCKQGIDLAYMSWIGYYIARKKPDIIVHIGDNYDMASLSFYDKGKLAAEGRRVSEDIIAGDTGIALIEAEINKVQGYNPRKVFCLGNHEERIDRYVSDNPEFEGLIGTDKLAVNRAGWEVQPFLKPIKIHGINFMHYIPNPMSGKPYGGTVQNILKNAGASFVMGHKQVLDIAMRPTVDGRHQLGVVVGACYAHDEAYKGYTGNNHFRGCVMLTEVEDGFALPSPVSLQYMRKVYDAHH
ncbi:metallo-dependent phosphoesterase [Vibrio phage vB_VhaP_VH-5]|uniref:Metallo-dependent phosphoesterase n=1 Tax=Vibrio phage vB_VhaP_VH-5 TaxID=2660694 RepID=A0A5Q2W9X0_9CAUD|nr:metallo-dependent phosphoesterase [Vibrio phage vB_VhaP_VH-5]